MISFFNLCTVGLNFEVYPCVTNLFALTRKRKGRHAAMIFAGSTGVSCEIFLVSAFLFCYINF